MLIDLVRQVTLELFYPLSFGMISIYEDNNIWIDFLYEHLLHFYYYGTVVYYGKNCEEVPYDEQFFSTDKEYLFGPWLTIEANEYSLF